MNSYPSLVRRRLAAALVVAAVAGGVGLAALGIPERHAHAFPTTATVPTLPIDPNAPIESTGSTEPTESPASSEPEPGIAEVVVGEIVVGDEVQEEPPVPMSSEPEPGTAEVVVGEIMVGDEVQEEPPVPMSSEPEPGTAGVVVGEIMVGDDVVEERSVAAAVPSPIARATETQLFISDDRYGAPITIGVNVVDVSAPECTDLGICVPPAGSVSLFLDGQFVANKDLSVLSGRTGTTSFGGLLFDAGTHTVTARYIPFEPLFFNPSSTSGTVEIAKADCTATLEPSFATASYGDPAVLIANVTSSSEAGRIRGGTLTARRVGTTEVLRTISPFNGASFVGVEGLELGNHWIVADYVDDNHNNCTSNDALVEVVKADCTVALDPEEVNRTEGELTVFVADPESDSLNGSVRGGTLDAYVDLDSDGEYVLWRTISPFGEAGFVGLADLPSGTHAIIVEYADANHNGCSSNVAVAHIYEAPGAVDDAYTIEQGEGYIADVLANDHGGDDLEISGATEPGHGFVHIEHDVEDDTWAIRYVPDDGYAGEDSFTYTITNGAAASDTATVTFTIIPFEFEAVDDEATTDADETVVIDVLANDTGYKPEYSLYHADAEHGSVYIDGSDSTVVYTPDPGFTGTDTFTYGGTSGWASSEAIVTVTVAAAPPSSDSTSTTTTTTLPDDQSTTLPDPDGGGPSTTTTPTTAPPKPSTTPVAGTPIAVADAYAVKTGESLLVAAPGVLVNDLASNSTALTATVVIDVDHGELVVNPDGSFAYTPDAGFVGTDTFSYVAGDTPTGPRGFAGQTRPMYRPSALSEPTTVTIMVTPTTNPDPQEASPVVTLPATR